MRQPLWMTESQRSPMKLLLDQALPAQKHHPVSAVTHDARRHGYSRSDIDAGAFVAYPPPHTKWSAPVIINWRRPSPAIDQHALTTRVQRQVEARRKPFEDALDGGHQVRMVASMVTEEPGTLRQPRTPAYTA